MRKIYKKLFATTLALAICFACTACVDTEIHSFTLSELPDAPISVGVTSDEFKVEVDYFRSFQFSDINVAVADDSIICIDYEVKESLTSGFYVSYTITGLQSGTTSYYFETADHTVKSDKIVVNVVDNGISDIEKNESDQEWTYEVVRSFVDLYNEKLDPDIVEVEEFIVEDRLLEYDGAYAIHGDIEGEYILIMNCGPWEMKDKMRIDTYADTFEGIIKVLCDVSSVIGEQLTEAEVDQISKNLQECFKDGGVQHTQWENINNIFYICDYSYQGETYKIQIEFSIKTFFEQ